MPIECGFNKTGGGNLPSIISDCVKLYAHQEDPNPAGTSETLAKAFIYDGFFLPSEIPVSMLPLNNPVLYSVDGTTSISFSYTGEPSGIKAFTGSANSGRWDINIQYINSNANWILKTISIQDKRTDTYIYNYDNCNTVYPGYDFYVYFPIEYYLRGHLGYGKAFQQIVTQKPRTYEYKINEHSLPGENTEVWIRQL